MITIVVGLLVGWPHENLLGGRDAGVYVNTAILLAKNGSIQPDDALLPEILAAGLDQLVREGDQRRTVTSPANEVHPGLVGFAVDRDAPSRLQPHGLPLFPILLALFVWIGGPSAALHGAGLFAVLGAGATILLGRRLFGGAAGAVAGLLVALSPAVLWHARQSAAEPLALLLVLGGLWAMVLGFQRQNLAAVAVAGAALGLSHLTKIELVAIPAALAVWLVWRLGTGRSGRVDAVFTTTYVSVLALAVIYWTTAAAWYTQHIAGIAILSLVRLLESLSPVSLMLVPVAAAGALALRRSSWHVPITMLALAALIAGLLPRPFEPAALPAHLTVQTNTLPGPTMQLAWYVSWPTLILALAGIWRLFRTPPCDHSGSSRAALAVLATGGILALAQPMVVPDHFWASRRLIVMAIPFVALIAGFGFMRLWVPVRSPLALVPGSWPLVRNAWLQVRTLVFSVGGHPSKMHRSIHAIHAPHPSCWGRGRPESVEGDRGERGSPRLLLLVGAVVLSVWAFWPFLGHREFGGAGQQVAAIATLTSDDALILIDRGDLGVRLALPLWASYDRNVLALDRETLQSERFREFLARQPASRSVYWLGIELVEDTARWQVIQAWWPGATPPVPYRYRDTVLLQLRYAETPIDRLPRRIDQQMFAVHVYQLR